MNPALAISDRRQANESRRQPRTHLFVVATLYGVDVSSPAHIRNLSASGALIEASVLPEPGVEISLKRGSLETRGKLAWKVGRKAGVAFDSAIAVEDWLPRKAGSSQATVDKIVFDIKAEQGVPMRAVLSQPAPPPIAIELTLLKTDLATLEDALTADPALIAAHPELQLLDVSIQRVGRIMTRLSAGKAPAGQ